MRPVMVLLVTLTLLAAVPLASAQFSVPSELEVTVDAVPALEPGVAAMVSGTVVYRTGSAAPGSGTTTVTLALDGAPEWVQASVEPASWDVTVPPDALAAGGFETTLPFNLTLTAAADAPAHEEAGLTLVAEASENPPHGASEAEATAALMAAYVGGFTVTAPTDPVRLDVAADAPAPNATVLIENLANGDTRFTFEVAENPTGLEVTLPEEIVLQSSATGGNATEATVSVLFAPTADVAEDTYVDVRVTAVDAADTTGNASEEIVRIPVAAATTAEGNGEDSGSFIPGPGVALVAVAGALAARVTARARR